MKTGILLIFILLSSAFLYAQGGILSNLSFEYGIQLPFGKMADRFGMNFKLGSEFELLHPETKWLAGVEGHYLFGSDVKDNVLAQLRNNEGDIIGNNREPASVFLRERGYHVGIYGGKILPLFGRDQLKGIKLSLGAGFLQHKIRVQDDSQTVSQLTGEYAKGYDRLTNGMSITGFAGYQHYDPGKNLYFLFGFDLVIGLTENRRSLNFDTMEKEDEKRTDGLAGFRVGWILPIGKGTSTEETYY